MWGDDVETSIYRISKRARHPYHISGRRDSRHEARWLGEEPCLADGPKKTSLPESNRVGFIPNINIFIA